MQVIYCIVLTLKETLIYFILTINGIKLLLNMFTVRKYYQESNFRRRNHIHLQLKLKHFQSSLLTQASPVYNVDHHSYQRAASFPYFLLFLDYSMTDPVFSGVRGLISELKPEQHNLHL